MLCIDNEPDSEDLYANLQDSGLSWPEIELIWKKNYKFQASIYQK